MALPDRTHSRGRNKEASLAQLVAGAHLAKRRLIDRQLAYRGFSRLVHPVLRVGLAACLLDKRFHPAFLHRSLVAVEGISRQAHHLAGPGHVTQLGGQVQQPELVFDRTLVETLHGVTSWFSFDSRLAPLSKRVTPPFASRRCQIRSRLLHLKIERTDQRHPAIKLRPEECRKLLRRPRNDLRPGVLSGL